MTRSLPSLFLGFIALTLICLQGVFGFIEPGTYLIQTIDDKYLSIGPVPPVIPPLDIPARLSARPRDHLWEVRPADDGGYTIREVQRRRRGEPTNVYGLNRNEDEAVILSARKAPQSWAVDSAGEGLFTIGVVNQDSLATVNEDEYPPIILQPANGSPDQRWRFVRVDRFSSTRSAMYGKSRFNLQCGL
ncbi:hypothetical protein EMPS_05446 [Entomortierella parvispora]|uniref:Ricin B lectin domain-containing protein n=1 Tax=Entomortierella parvispora TaxID=205924 RepID=A0A9P3LWH6_9FUNG|nr:hypothetical protein EMPS_05446 [Entomortierella parvispora]